MKKCTKYEVEVLDQEGEKEDLKKGCAKCQAHKLNVEDAMDRSRWKKLIKLLVDDERQLRLQSQ